MLSDMIGDGGTSWYEDGSIVEIVRDLETSIFYVV